MGLFSRMIGFEKYQAFENALLGDYLMKEAPLETQGDLANFVIKRFVRLQPRRSEDDIINHLDELPRALQLQFIANAAVEFGLQDFARGVRFTMMPNPYITRDWLTDDALIDHANWVGRKRDIATYWMKNNYSYPFGALAACASESKLAS